MTTCTIKSCVSDFLSQASSPLLVIRIVLSKHPKGQMLVMFWHLRWQTELLSLENFCNIQIEEVTVQHGLDHTSNNSYEVKKSLKVVAPNPVDQVQGTVQTQEKKIVSSDGLCFPSFADHKKLRENSNRLKIDGEGPQYLQWREVMIDKKGEPTNRNYQKLHPEGVMVSIIGGLELHVDQVHGGVRASDVDELHRCVIQ